MTMRPSSFSILLLSPDPDLQTHLRQEFKDSSVTVAKDSGSATRATAKRAFDAVLVETKRGQLTELVDMHRAIDPTRTMILAGPRSVLRQASGLVHAMRNGHARSLNGTGQNPGLEEYIELKLGEFVKGMKSSSARNLYHMFISAVERPLIALALKETNGNQIQAAQLLGVNRNTLRKKITELRIPVKRERTRKA
jgi:two-component system nitrogen regulation response regulator GlnG